MSKNYTIQNGFVLANITSLEEVHAYVQELQESLKPILDEHWAKLLLDVSTAKYDLHNAVKTESDVDKFDFVNHTRLELMREMVSATNERRHSYVNVSSVLYLVKYDGKIYGFLYTGNSDVVDYFMGLDGVIPVEENDSVWEQIFETNDIPNQRMLSIVLSPHAPRDVNLEDFISLIPSMERRIDTTGEGAAIKEYENQITEGLSDEEIEDKQSELSMDMWTYSNSDDFKNIVESKKEEVGGMLDTDLTLDKLRGA